MRVLSAVVALSACACAPPIELAEDQAYEGDIVLDGDDEPSGRATEALFAERSATRLWPDGVVPYRIHSSVTTPGRVRAAMREWEEKTAIRFVPRDGEAAYVDVLEQDGNTVCRAQVGYTGGRRYVYLRDTSIRTSCNLGVIVHELGHTLGLWHEHTRPDRNEHVRIHWDYVGSREAFEIKTSGVRTVGAYDIASTMHYRSFTYSRPSDRASITRRDGSLILHDWADLSRGDVRAMEALYGRATETMPDAGTVEPDAGVDPDAGVEPGELTVPGPVAMLDPEERLDRPRMDDEIGDATITGGCSASGRSSDASATLLVAFAIALVRRRPRPARRV